MTWTPEQAQQLTEPQEVRLAPLRRDGSLTSSRIIWIVGADGRVYVRSTNGADGAWYRSVIATGLARLEASGSAFDVRLSPVEDQADLARIDAAYQVKYGGVYPSIVEHLVGPGPRATSLQVEPA